MSEQRMTNELVKSLRDYSEGPSSYWLPICRKAADLIEQLDADCLLLQCERDMLKQQRADWKAVADSRPIRAAVEPATEHPPQLMAVVDKWQDLANRWRELTPRRDREDAALVELILREIRETIAPSSSVTKSESL
jgi:hypothetical protein